LKKPVIALFAFLLVISCENVDRSMYDQKYAKVEKVEAVLPPAGSVPALGMKIKIDYSQVDLKKLAPPFPLDARAGERGAGLYGVYCAPCHGITGNSDTKIARKMDLAPPALTTDRVRKELGDSEIFVKILASDSLMPKYRAELEDNEAWEIVAHVRGLGQSRK
jgi:mono/diheme cytochrome c family protein